MNAMSTNNECVKMEELQNGSVPEEPEMEIKEEETEIKSEGGEVVAKSEQSPTPTTSSIPTDEYHYLKSGEYTSENFKVCVKNIPRTLKSYGRLRGELRKMLGFNPKKMKYNPSENFCFLAMANEEERTLAIEKLHHQVLKKAKLVCTKAAPMKDPLVRERKRQQENKNGDEGNERKRQHDSNNVNELDEGEREEKRQCESQVNTDPPEDRILQAVCPYACKPYDEQLSLKEEAMAKCMKKLYDDMVYQKVGKEWRDERGDGKCVDLLSIIKSPVLDNYRNKVEFSIGLGPDGKGKTVGFRLGSYREGCMTIVEPNKCINCSTQSLQLANEFQQFIRGLPYDSYNSATHQGCWQQLNVRSCSTNDVMLIVQVQKTHLKEEEIADIEYKLIQFASCADLPVKVTSLYLAWCKHGHSSVDNYKHLMGNEYIYERLLGLQFRISPQAFFQVNTTAAEVLYQTVVDWCDLASGVSKGSGEKIVLDVCCGTGTIGLCVAKNTSCKVYGIELCKQAVQDAVFNAEFNKIPNAKFVCEPAEKAIGEITYQIKTLNNKGCEAVAIVDPPRAGLNRKVIEYIRKCKAIKKVIYVSCSPNQARNNWIQFCRDESRKNPGTPFQLVRAVPVDLFPHTPHCELILELVRIVEEDEEEEGEKEKVGEEKADKQVENDKKNDTNKTVDDDEASSQESKDTSDSQELSTSQSTESTFSESHESLASSPL